MKLRTVALYLWAWYRASYSQFVVIACGLLAVFWVGWIATDHTVPVWRALPVAPEWDKTYASYDWTMPYAASGWWFSFAPILISVALEVLISWRQRLEPDQCEAILVTFCGVAVIFAFAGYVVWWGCAGSQALVTVAFIAVVLDCNIGMDWSMLRDGELILCSIAIAGFIAGPTQGLLGIAFSIGAGVIIAAAMLAKDAWFRLKRHIRSSHTIIASI